MGKIYILSGLLTAILLLIGCVDSSTKYLDLSYEDLVERVEQSETSIEYLENYITISNLSTSINEANAGAALSFTYNLKNITDAPLTLSFVGYVPEELSQVYLSRNHLQVQDVTLEAGQELKGSLETQVKIESDLSPDEQLFYKENGLFLYMAMKVDEELFYLKFPMNEETRGLLNN